MVVYVFFGIVIGFFVLLLLKEIIGKKFCVICATFSFSWIILLVLYWLDYYKNLVLIGLLMGLSVLGAFYSWEKKVKRGLVFRLPVLLTLVYIGYLLLSFDISANAVISLLVLWVGFGLVYLYGSKGGGGRFMRKIVECCRRW